MDEKLYCARVGSEDLDSARQSKIEASAARDLQEEHHSQIGKGDEKDRFCEVAAGPNLQNLPARSIKDPWFKEGLRFACTGCGKCCTGSPGYVYLSPKDLALLAEHHHCSEEEFKKRYTRIVDEQLCLIDAEGSPDCYFLKNNQCSVYEARPVQCRTFPWWIHNLQTPRRWKEAAKHCEGINHPDAPLVSGEKIASECMTYLDNLIEQNFV